MLLVSLLSSMKMTKMRSRALHSKRVFSVRYAACLFLKQMMTVRRVGTTCMNLEKTMKMTMMTKVEKWTMIGRAWKLEDFNAFLHFVSVLNFVACRDDRGIHATLLEADDEEETTVSGRKCATLCNAATDLVRLKLFSFQCERTKTGGSEEGGQVQR